jgi:hypothetical protein
MRSTHCKVEQSIAGNGSGPTWQGSPRLPLGELFQVDRAGGPKGGQPKWWVTSPISSISHQLVDLIDL